MTMFNVIFFGFWIIVSAIYGQWDAVFAFFVLMGLVQFVWMTACDAGNKVAGKLSREQTNYNMTQNRFEVVESSSNDPTRPDEDLPAIIEIGRQRYTRIK